MFGSHDIKIGTCLIRILRHKVKWTLGVETPSLSARIFVVVN